MAAERELGGVTSARTGWGVGPGRGARRTDGWCRCEPVRSCGRVQGARARTRSGEGDRLLGEADLRAMAGARAVGEEVRGERAGLWAFGSGAERSVAAAALAPRGAHRHAAEEEEAERVAPGRPRHAHAHQRVADSRAAERDGEAGLAPARVRVAAEAERAQDLPRAIERLERALRERAAAELLAVEGHQRAHHPHREVVDGDGGVHEGLRRQATAHLARGRSLLWARMILRRHRSSCPPLHRPKFKVELRPQSSSRRVCWCRLLSLSGRPAVAGSRFFPRCEG